VAQELTQTLTEMSIGSFPWMGRGGLNFGRRVRMTTSPPSLSRLPRKCEILDVRVSQTRRPPWLIIWITLIFFTYWCFIKFVFRAVSLHNLFPQSGELKSSNSPVGVVTRLRRGFRGFRFIWHRSTYGLNYLSLSVCMFLFLKMTTLLCIVTAK
jgi:hypothetical protein